MVLGYVTMFMNQCPVIFNVFCHGAQEYYVKEIRLPSPEALQHRELPRFFEGSQGVPPGFGRSGQSVGPKNVLMRSMDGQLCAKERCRRRSESLDLPIERGVSFGQRLLFEMQADQQPQHVPGDPWRSRYYSKARCSIARQF